MNDGITLSELIKELQGFEKNLGDKKVLSIGSCCGQFVGLRNPFTIRFDAGGDVNLHEIVMYVATRKKDIGNSYAHLH